MSVVRFQCPSCQAPLRLENRALFLGRTFGCPDCGESLLISADGQSGVSATPIRTPDRGVNPGRQTEVAARSVKHPTRVETAAKVSDRGLELQAPMSIWNQMSRRPALLGWIVAALFAAILWSVVGASHNRGGTEPAPRVVVEKPTAATAPSESLAPQADPVIAPEASQPRDSVPAPVQPDDKPPPPQTDATVEAPRDTKPAEAAVADKPPVEPPKSVPVPPEPEPAPQTLTPEAVEAKLQQKIARFDQTKPVPFVKVVDTIEELAGIPIVWDLDRVDEQQLQKPVTLRLQQTTVAEILDTLLKQVGLERRTVEGKIELAPSSQNE